MSVVMSHENLTVEIDSLSEMTNFEKHMEFHEFHESFFFFLRTAFICTEMIEVKTSTQK